MKESEPSSPLGIIHSSNKALTVTNNNFEELRSQITDLYNQRIGLLKELRAAKSKMGLLTFVQAASYLVIIGFFWKKITESSNHCS